VRVEHPIVRLIARLQANPNAIKPSRVEEWKGDEKLKIPPRRHFSYNHPRVDGCDKFSIGLRFLRTPTGIDQTVWDASIDGEVDPLALGTRVSVAWQEEPRKCVGASGTLETGSCGFDLNWYRVDEGTLAGTYYRTEPVSGHPDVRGHVSLFSDAMLRRYRVTGSRIAP
jgi:hypothetical protein